MLRILAFLILSVLIGLGVSSISAATEVVELTTANMVLIRGPVTDQSMKQAQQELLDAVKARGKGKNTIYVVLDTPGGSIFDGVDFINYAKTISNVKTITIQAASMGAIIVEKLPGERLITEDGTIMFHRPWANVQGQFATGELETRLAFLKKVVTKLTTQVAARMGWTLEQYNAKVKDELWLYGADAITENAVDRVVELRCSDALIKETQTLIQQIFIFEIEVTQSRCPLLK